MMTMVGDSVTRGAAVDAAGNMAPRPVVRRP